MLSLLEIVCLILLIVVLLPIDLGSDTPLGAELFAPPKVTGAKKNTNTNNKVLPYMPVRNKSSMRTLQDQPRRFEKGNSSQRSYDPIPTDVVKPPPSADYPRDVDPAVSKHEGGTQIDTFVHGDVVMPRRY